MGNIQMTEEQLQKMLLSVQQKAYDTARKNTPGSTTLPAGGMLHGYTQDGSGNLNVLAGAGVRPEMWSAMVRPRSLARLLGAPKPSRNANEKIEIQTGVTEAAGTNVDTWCESPPDVTGDMKVCRQQRVFGEYHGKTKLKHIPKIGERFDYADVPREIINAGPSANPLIPDLMYKLDDTENVLQYNLWLFGQRTELTLERVLVQGNSALASANTQLGWMSEFQGLDTLIATGYTDSVTGQLCPAADSYVLDFNTALGNTMADTEGRYIQDAINDMIYALQTRAEDNSVTNFGIAAVMRREFFRKLTDFIACNYASDRCNSPYGSKTSLNVAGSDYVAWRDGMRRGQYILVGGQQIPVVFSTGVDLEGTAQNQFRTDIYFVPTQGNGRQLTYLDFFPLDNEYAIEYANFPSGSSEYRTYNNGLWAAAPANTPFCREFHFASRMRLMLDTPFLAGRIDNIVFNYDVNMTHDPYAGESMYVDGGVSYRTAN